MAMELEISLLSSQLSTNNILRILIDRNVQWKTFLHKKAVLDSHYPRKTRTHFIGYM